MSNFILVCTDAVSPDGEKLSAETLAEDRLSAHRWPLYPRTPHQAHMTSGDRVVVYLGGKRPGARSFYALGHVELLERVAFGKGFSCPELEGHRSASSWLLLKNVQVLSPRVPVSEILPKLSFWPKAHNNWGAVFRSGVRAISDEDWEVIIGKTKDGMS